MDNNFKKDLLESTFIARPLKEDNHSIEKKWFNKKVYEEVDLLKANHFNLTSYKKLIKEDDLCFELDPDIEGIKPRPNPSACFQIDLDNELGFNRILMEIEIIDKGFRNHYFQMALNSDVLTFNHNPSVASGKSIIAFELDEDCKKINNLFISFFLSGASDEVKGNFKFIIRSVKLQKVDLDKVYGFEASSELAYSHVGYFKKSLKQAISSKGYDKFYLLKDKTCVFEGIPKKEIYKDNAYYVLDFSSFEEEGLYTIKYGDEVSNSFPISDDAYDEAIWKSINFLYTLRCGEAIPGMHSACHLNCKSVHDGKTVPNFGGWHDAGDLSQFEIPTAEITESLIDLSREVKDEVLKKRLLDEAYVGCNWLLRTIFHDGFRALSVTYSSFRKSLIPKDFESIYTNEAECGPFELLLSSSALLKASLAYDDKIFADWCYNTGLEDYEMALSAYEKGIYTKRWGPSIDAQVAGIGAKVASLLFNITKNNKYFKDATRFKDILISCQEQSDEYPLKGFFYESGKHDALLVYEHRGHEDAPLVGLSAYYESFNGSDVKHALELYRDYLVESLKKGAPYGLLPAGIYIPDKMNYDRFTIPSYWCTHEEGIASLDAQIRKGIKLDEKSYLRMMPIAVQRRGFFATLLAKTKALTCCAISLKDRKLLEKANVQMEWILGKNPFAISCMYGVGFNYHPLYVAYSPQMIGALPVGIMTKGDEDEPYWPVRVDAVYKEVWGHTTGKFLWVLADILKSKGQNERKK